MIPIRDQSCCNCAHDGCCLDYCGGRYWKEAKEYFPKKEVDDPFEDYDPHEAWRVEAERWQEQMDRKW